MHNRQAEREGGHANNLASGSLGSLGRDVGSRLPNGQVLGIGGVGSVGKEIERTETRSHKKTVILSEAKNLSAKRTAASYRIFLNAQDFALRATAIATLRRGVLPLRAAQDDGR